MTDHRQSALQALYEADQTGSEEVTDGLSVRSQRLVKGVLDEISTLDRTIAAAAENWRMDRMPVVDRCILRLALFELRHDVDTPVGVIISEAVRLAKEFSTERSGAFINGVLAALAEKERGRPPTGGLSTPGDNV